MERDTTETTYTLVIIGLKDDRAKRRVAAALSRVTKQLSEDRILERLGSLPWTLTRRATLKRATRLVRLLESLGARIQVLPPLPEDQAVDVGETQIMPSAELITETQVANATQFIQRPEQMQPSEPELEKPAVVARPVAVPPAYARPPEPRKTEPAVREESQPSAAEGPGMGPLTLGGILDRTFQISRAHFWKLAAIAVLPGLVATVYNTLLGAVELLPVFQWPAWVLVVGTIILVPVLVVGGGICLFLPRAALILALSEICLGRDFRVADVLRAMLPKLVPFVLTSLLFGLAVAGTLVATGLSAAVLGGLYIVIAGWVLPSSLVWLAWLPGLMLIPVFTAVPLYIWVKWSLCEQAFVLEGVKYGAALQRSWHLLSGRAGKEWYTTHVTRLGILLIAFTAIQLAIFALFQGPAWLFAYASSSQVVGQVAANLLSLCTNVLIGVFSATFTVLFYYDLRNRKEGLDLILLAQENGEPQRE